MVLCDDLDRWDGAGMGVGERLQRQRPYNILKADSCCAAEANTTLSSYYPPIKNKQINKKLLGGGPLAIAHLSS